MAHILFVNQYASVADEAGPIRHFSIARSLANEGCKSTLIRGTFDHVAGLQRSLPRSQDIGDLRVLNLHVKPYKNTKSRFVSMLHFGMSVARLQEADFIARPSVVVGSSPHLFAALGALKLAKKLDIPFVMEVRDIWPLSLVGPGLVNPKHPVISIFKLVETKLYREADRIVAVMPGFADYAPQFSSKVRIIPNGISSDILRVCEETRPLSKIKDVHSYQFAYAGVLGATQGLGVVLEAAKIVWDRNVRDVQILLIGDGPEKAELIELAKALDLKNVHFLGSLPRREMFRRLHSSCAQILPLIDSPQFKYGACPTKLPEYMAIGKPIILAANLPRNPIEEHDLGLQVPAGDPAGLAEAILTIRGWHEIEFDEVEKRSRPAAALFDYESISRAYGEMVLDILG